MIDHAESQDDGTTYRVVEICAGAGGQALGLEKAGFEHAVAVELDSWACQTLRLNRDWRVAEGDVADRSVWNPAEYEGIDLLAGGVPCPPFSIAGKQLGASDERDLFAWAVELVQIVRPRALMLENVRGLSQPRFAAYRQRVLDQLAEYGYVAEWRLLQASDFGVPQLRPRFVLVALKLEDAAHFHWPEPIGETPTVGEALRDLMGAKNWKYLDRWVAMANDIGPTLVGGSKKHGGADLGPTRAKAAWRALGVDGMGIANDVPARSALSPINVPPKLTIEMVARLQGWAPGEWQFAGRKTAQYRQIGNAFPPPVAKAIGSSIIAAFDRSAPSREIESFRGVEHDDLYRFLRTADDFVTAGQILSKFSGVLTINQLEARIANLSRDFAVDVRSHRGGSEVEYMLGEFRGFVGQEDHLRHDYIAKHRSRVS